MSPDRNPYDPNYVPNPERRRLLKTAGTIAGGMATAAGVYEFFTQVLPAIGNALHNINVDAPSSNSSGDNSGTQQTTPEATSQTENVAEWMKHPVNSFEWRITNQNEGNIDFQIKPHTIAVLSRESTDGNGKKVFSLDLYVNKELSSVLPIGSPGGSPDLVEMYNAGNDINKWSDLRQFKARELLSSHPEISYVTGFVEFFDQEQQWDQNLPDIIR